MLESQTALQSYCKDVFMKCVPEAEHLFRPVFMKCVPEADHLGGIPGSRFCENSELFNPENRQTPRFPFQKER